MKIGRITVSDRASAGIYADRSGPEIERILSGVFGADAFFVAAIVPDGVALISAKLREFADDEQCDLIVTTGGTGISARDVTPEATHAVLEKEFEKRLAIGHDGISLPKAYAEGAVCAAHHSRQARR